MHLCIAFFKGRLRNLSQTERLIAVFIISIMIITFIIMPFLFMPIFVDKWSGVSLTESNARDCQTLICMVDFGGNHQLIKSAWIEHLSRYTTYHTLIGDYTTRKTSSRIALCIKLSNDGVPISWFRISGKNGGFSEWRGVLYVEIDNIKNEIILNIFWIGNLKMNPTINIH